MKFWVLGNLILSLLFKDWGDGTATVEGGGEDERDGRGEAAGQGRGGGSKQEKRHIIFLFDEKQSNSENLSF